MNDTIPWYKSATLRMLLISFVSQLLVWLGVTDSLPEGSVAVAVDAALQVIAIASVAWAAWARARKPTPPVTAIAAQRTEERAAVVSSSQAANVTPPPTNAGFARTAFLALVVGLMLSIGVPLFVAGCTAVGVTQPATTEQRLAYAYGTHTAILDAAATAVEAGRMSPDDGEHVLKMADDARVILDASRIAFAAGDVATANDRLLFALNILTQLQEYLNQRTAKP
jgi:hypothetical protein